MRSTTLPRLLDGGMGRELRARGVPIPETIWSANALLVAPDTVRALHADYLQAGADVITTNTYGVIRADLAKEGIEHRFAELCTLACELAIEAKAATGSSAVIAGSLPPLRGSYRPDLVGPLAEIEPVYTEQARLMAPLVDLFLCETMSSAREAVAAVRAAASTSKPIWVAWTLHEDRSGRLRSGETVAEAVAALAGLPVTGFLANCCAPESITTAMPALVEAATVTPGAVAGGYANAFAPVPETWSLDGPGDEDGLLSLRDDLDPAAYTSQVEQWLDLGATAIGGCCGTGPAHITRLRSALDCLYAVQG